MLGVVTVASPGVSSAVSSSNDRANTTVTHVDAVKFDTWQGSTIGAHRTFASTLTGVRPRMHGGASGALGTPPAQRYEGLSICTEVVAGISYVTIIFVNEGSSNCYLSGTPHTQPVGATYMPVGPPAAAYFDPSRGGDVILDAGGGAASTSLGIANAGKYYPRSSCVPKKMIGVTLRFSYPADFFFRMGAGPVAVCKKITTTTITGVVRGVVEGP
jgi:hypothetical protein